MMVMVFLAIESPNNGLTIAVVGAPFALMRGGASPANPRAVFIITLVWLNPVDDFEDAGIYVNNRVNQKRTGRVSPSKEP